MNAERSHERRVGMRVQRAMVNVAIRMPELSSTAHDTWVEVDRSLDSCAISADGVLIAGLSFVDSLTDDELEFVVAHELSHRRLGHHARGKGAHAQRFNVAADAVINERLVERLGQPVPRGGIRDARARGRSAEHMFFQTVATGGGRDIDERERRPDRRRRRAPPAWGPPLGFADGFERRDLDSQLCIGSDLVHETSAFMLGRGGRAYRSATTVQAKAMDASALLGAFAGELASPTRLRTYARRSRRQDALGDERLVLAGRRSERRPSLALVVDTSLSCVLRLPEVFGLARDFVARAGLGGIDVALSDGERTRWLPAATPESLASVWLDALETDEFHVASMICSNCNRHYAFRYSNRCFGSLEPVFAELELRGVRRALVFTDGLVGLPRRNPLEDVVFALERLPERMFKPGFGRVVDQPRSVAKEAA